MWMTGNLHRHARLFLLLSPFRCRQSGSSASISSYPYILLYHINPLHALLHYLHESSLGSSSFPPGLQLHIRHPLSSLSTIPPLHMFKLSQLCRSYFLSSLFDLSRPSDLFISNLPILVTTNQNDSSAGSLLTPISLAHLLWSMIDAKPK